MLLLIQFHLWYYYNFPPISCSSQSEGAKCKHHGWIRGGGDLVWRWLGGRRSEQEPGGAGGQQPLGMEDCCRWALLELAKRVCLENVLFLVCASSGPCLVAFPNTSHGWLEVSDSVLPGSWWWGQPRCFQQCLSCGALFLLPDLPSAGRALMSPCLLCSQDSVGMVAAKASPAHQRLCSSNRKWYTMCQHFHNVFLKKKKKKDMRTYYCCLPVLNNLCKFDFSRRLC